MRHEQNNKLDIISPSASIFCYIAPQVPNYVHQNILFGDIFILDFV